MASDSRVLAGLTARVVAAYVGKNTVTAADLPDVIQSVHASLMRLSDSDQTAAPLPEALVPAVSIRKSVTADFIVCLEDGKKMKMLKRHLMTRYGLTPDAYRAKWNLPKDYPMVAPNYAQARADTAKRLGLGRRRAED
ncbi:MAG: MucR family transcriptional regulator [Azospirillum sp.]|nr:MucR family transcriptional regulator [Azospirillum sp.]